MRCHPDEIFRGSGKLLTKYTAILAMESYDKMYQNIPKCTKYTAGAMMQCYRRNIIRDTVEMFCCAMLTMRRHRRNIISATNEILRVPLLMWNTIMGETFHVARNVDFLENLNPSIELISIFVPLNKLVARDVSSTMTYDIASGCEAEEVFRGY